ncbi:MAG: radical SAM protein [Magnetococcales bacterium]|nr:radical SAM protein [Magnetococcales bacterium]
MKLWGGRILTLRHVWQRIRYFNQVFPLSSLLKDLFLLPWDYLRTGNRVETVRMVQIFVTTDCNQRCAMCYVHKEVGRSRHLPLECYRELVDALRDQRPCILLMGGEPLMHPDLVEMVAYAKAAGCVTQTFTNGTLVRQETFDALVAAGLDYLNLSLLGTRATHNAVAGIPRAYDLFLRNLEYLAPRRGKTQVVINFTLTPTTVSDAHHAFELAARFGLDGVRLQHYMYLTPEESLAQEQVMSSLFGTTPETQEIQTDAKEVIPFCEAVIRLRREVQVRYPHVSVQWAPTLSESEIRQWYGEIPFKTRRGCYFPWRGMLVNADGVLYPCTKIFLELGRLDGRNPLDVWNADDMLLFRQQLKKGLYPACSRCCKL